MAQIPDDKVQEVRDRVDIVDLVGRYVELRRSGQNFKGLCPFHEERTPSFNVNPARKGYKCFGCGASGDAIKFVEELEGKGFIEAIRKLADLYGVDLPSPGRGDDRRSAERRSERDQSLAITALATEIYRKVLIEAPEGQTGRDYQAARGIDDETAERFRIGYAPDPSEAGWDTLARAIAHKKLSLELAQKLGLLGQSERTGNYYDKFRGRLMFPVIDPGGDVIAFSGRIVPPHEDRTDPEQPPPPKYVNSPESSLFSKGKALFGLHAARSAIREAGRVLLVEGNIDVVSLHQRGLSEAVAPLGTALTEKQAHLLSRFCRQVVLCFDGDKAGKTAAAAALPLLLEKDLDTRIVLLEDGDDPDSVDPERLRHMVGAAGSALEARIIRLANRAGGPLGPIDARSRALDEAMGLIVKVPRDSARYLYAERAADLLGFPLERVRGHVERLARGKNSPQIPSTSGRPVSLSAPVQPAPPLPDGQAELATLLVDLPHLASLAERSGALDRVTDPRLSPIVRAVIEGAKGGKNLSMPELLELVDVPSQQLVHDVVFSGRYRNLDGTAELTANPGAEMHALLRRCDENEINARIRDIDERTREAQRSGDTDAVRELQQQRLELRRRQSELREDQRLGESSTEPAPN